MRSLKLGPEAMEHGDLKRLLVSFCVPSLLSSLVTSVYNIVDQLFIGNAMGILGNAATNVVFPAVTLITALSLMCGVGTSAVMNLALGNGDMEKARHAAGCGIGLMILCGGVVSAAMLIFTEPLLYLFGCTDAVLPYAMPYARITAVAYIFSLIGTAGPFLLRADGSPGFALVCTVAGSVLNVALDALFIFGFHWGIRGAAWATVISQLVSAAMVLVYLPHFKTLRLDRSAYKPNGKLYLNIAALGAGPMFNFLTQALVQIFLNGALRTYGGASIYGSETALAVAGVANKVNTIAVAVVTGLSNGMQPIVSYNYGKGNYKRVAETGKLVIKVILIVSFVIFLCYQLIPRQITALFGDGDDDYFAFAASYFRIFLMLICVNGLQSSVGGFFSAQGKPKQSILISLTRQVLMLPPLLIILPRFFGLNGVLWAGPIADFAMAVLAGFLLRNQLNELRMNDDRTAV
ncbi:MATE family efflux transporter [Anaerovorax odorimutans]|uniref:Multidrug export protein MepA n=1 Tax=Anaerovorax odorimutans TaxID=109327 RepID=A0ABT1RPD3_9FIRM|nr:MATE family efflux transporter [Anaerovorax odorimutans]MCQ4637052.1 MATE family efflux transporter [Anaerovorax odorimutans]